jgi:hypothetical protein
MTVPSNAFSAANRVAVPWRLIVVRHGAAASLFYRQPRLRAVEGLNLAFLVGAQYNGMLRRVEVKTDYRLELFSEVGIVADLEGPGQVRLETVFVPDTAHALFAETGRLCHRSRAPVSCVGRLLLRGLTDHLLDLYGCNDRPAAATRGVFFQTG